MFIDASEATPPQIYQFLVGIVTPRPIAWVTTRDARGRTNLAPYSFFNVFGSNPPVVVFSPTIRPDGSRKDTLNNILETGEFVINAAVQRVAEAVNLSSIELPPGECEAEFAGLSLVPSRKVKPPRVAESPAHLECRLIQVVPVGDGPMAANLVIGEVLGVHVDESILDEAGRIDPRRLQTIGRLNGDFYSRVGDLFEMQRPNPR